MKCLVLPEFLCLCGYLIYLLIYLVNAISMPGSTKSWIVENVIVPRFSWLGYDFPQCNTWEGSTLASVIKGFTHKKSFTMMGQQVWTDFAVTPLLSSPNYKNLWRACTKYRVWTEAGRHANYIGRAILRCQINIKLHSAKAFVERNTFA